MDNVRASLLMVVAMALFAIEDAFVKRAALYIPVGEILMIIGGGGFLVLAVLAQLRGESVLDRAFFHRPVMLRNAGEFAGTIGFVTALALIPISTASVILQASPLLVTAGAALFLGETVGWRRWTAVAFGLAGVLVVMRPGLEGFAPEAMWAVLGAVGLSIRDLATRRIRDRVSTLQVSAWGFATLIPAGIVAMGIGPPPGMPPFGTALELTLAVAIGLAGYSTMTFAIRTGDLAVVAPFRYSRIVFALIVGFVAFGERPDLMMILGAALIVGSGLYALMRERRLRAASP